jgi:alkanesulfonate monooxygenase SsuD/methylene tetrahydromethanopterin reductase-like flavin-dependent oxidoreductase (luciferase family)
VPYPPVAERFERLEETLQICEQMWSDNDGPYQGQHYQLAETICVPPPIQRPRPPILIGGGGEKKTLRIVAQHADIWHSFVSAEDLPRKLDILREHGEAVGRDISEIELSNEPRVKDLALADDLRAQGVTLFTIGISGPDYPLDTVKEWLAWRDAQNA